MNRNPVSSSNLHSVGYDDTSQTLEVEFKNGAVYQYFDVSSAEYAGLLGASSLGSYFAANIRQSYRYSRI